MRVNETNKLSKKLWPKNSSTTHLIHSESEKQEIKTSQNTYIEPKKSQSKKKKNLTYNCRLKESVCSTQDFLTVTPDFLHPRKKQKKKTCESLWWYWPTEDQIYRNWWKFRLKLVNYWSGPVREAFHGKKGLNEGQIVTLIPVLPNWHSYRVEAQHGYNRDLWVQLQRPDRSWSIRRCI